MSDNIEHQRRLYGEPLADICGRLQERFRMTQAGLAGVLGLSAPMLSQLLSGHRAKIGNPAVLGRLQALIMLSEDSAALTPAQVLERIEHIRDTTPTITSSASNLVRELRFVAPPKELLRLAELTTVPALAKLLRRAAADG